MKKRHAVLLLLFLAGCRQREPLPRLFSVPPASLVDDSGRRFDLQSLRGHIVVYDFIFTRCGATCPVLTRRVSELVERSRDRDVRFVSISVDPEHDTPAVLHAYASRVRRDPRWIFATGDPATIRQLSVNGFKLAATPAAGEREPIVHSSRFVLVDRSGVIRAYYDSARRESVEEAAGAIEGLRSE